MRVTTDEAMVPFKDHLGFKLYKDRHVLIEMKLKV